MNKNSQNNVRYAQLDQEGTQKVAAEVYKLMKEGMTLQEATGLSDEILEEIYTLAYGYYNQGKYNESIALFEFLSNTAPKNYKYVLGLASSYHQLEAYEIAALSFYIAAELEPHNPIPAYFLLDCLLKQKEFEAAEEAVDITMLICGDKAEYRDLKERCRLVRESLKVKNV